jgi:hypothetical protein
MDNLLTFSCIFSYLCEQWIPDALLYVRAPELCLLMGVWSAVVIDNRTFIHLCCSLTVGSARMWRLYLSTYATCTMNARKWAKFSSIWLLIIFTPLIICRTLVFRGIYFLQQIDRPILNDYFFCMGQLHAQFQVVLLLIMSAGLPWSVTADIERPVKDKEGTCACAVSCESFYCCAQSAVHYQLSSSSSRSAPTCHVTNMRA